MILYSYSTTYTQARLGADSPAVAELRALFAMAEAYGYADWLVLDISVVRGERAP